MRKNWQFLAGERSWQCGSSFLTQVKWYQSLLIKVHCMWLERWGAVFSQQYLESTYLVCLNCGFLYSRAPLRNLAGFAEGFYQFPNDAGVAHRTTAPLNIFAKNKESSYFQRNKPRIPVKQQEINFKMSQLKSTYPGQAATEGQENQSKDRLLGVKTGEGRVWRHQHCQLTFKAFLLCTSQETNVSSQTLTAAGLDSDYGRGSRFTAVWFLLRASLAVNCTEKHLLTHSRVGFELSLPGFRAELYTLMASAMMTPPKTMGVTYKTPVP